MSHSLGKKYGWLGQSPDDAVFIVGPPRSGTTLLRLMLNAHSGIAIPAETWVFYRLLKNAESFGAFSDSRQIEDFAKATTASLSEGGVPFGEMFRVKESQIKKALKKSDAFSFAEAMAAVMQLLADKKGKTRWGEKTPFYSCLLPILSSCFPNAKFIGMIRDPRDVVASMLKTNWGEQQNVACPYEAGQRWVTSASDLRWGEEHIGKDRFRILHYESLVNQPEEEMKQLLQFLSLDWEDKVLDPSSRPEKLVPKGSRNWHPNVSKAIDPTLNGSWKTRISTEDAIQVERAAGKAMETWGYTREFPTSSLIENFQATSWKIQTLKRRMTNSKHWSVMMKSFR